MPGQPETSSRQPWLILDTDIGGDPDDALTLVALCAAAPQLRLVITSDEVDGQRALFAQRLLALMGRPDVKIVAGAGYGQSRYLAIPRSAKTDATPVISNDVLGAVSDLAASAPGLQWLGIGPMTNLSSVLRAQPVLRTQMKIVQMGGAIAYRDPLRAEHNVRLDPDAARYVMETAKDLQLVTSDVTFDPRIEVTKKSAVFRALVRSNTAVSSLLQAHFTNWFENFYPGSMKHDVLAASLILDQPFLKMEKRKIELDPIGRMTVTETGTEVSLSKSADYTAFNVWSDQLILNALNLQPFLER